VLGDPRKLDDTLVSVLENRPAQCEVLVIHNEPYDDPYQLGNEVTFVEAWHDAGLGECLNLGVSVSTAPVVHVLTCGVEVGEDWATAALQRFQDPDVAAVAPIVVARSDRSRVVSAGLAYRSEGAAWRVGRGEALAGVAARAKQPLGPDLLAAFFRKSVLETLGGFALGMSNRVIGIELALTLRQIGARCVLEPDCLAHVDEAVVAERPSFAAGLDDERFFWRWASRNGLVQSVLGHAAMLTGECITALMQPRVFMQLAGRASCLVQAAFRGNLAPAQGVASILPGPHAAAASDGHETTTSIRVA
jgi:hypothetical protein